MKFQDQRLVLDDVFHNTVGTVIGYGVWAGWQKLKRWRLIRC